MFCGNFSKKFVSPCKKVYLTGQHIFSCVMQMMVEVSIRQCSITTQTCFGQVYCGSAANLTNVLQSKAAVQLLLRLQKIIATEPRQFAERCRCKIRKTVLQTTFQLHSVEFVDIQAVGFAEISKCSLRTVVGFASAGFPTVNRCKSNAQFFCHHFLAEIQLLSSVLNFVFKFHFSILRFWCRFTHFIMLIF